MTDLFEQRSAAVQQVLEDYDFGTYFFEDKSGFEHTSGSNEWSSVIFVLNEDDAEADVNSEKASFTVVFEEGSAEVVGAYSLLHSNGSTIGTPYHRDAVPAPAP